MAGTLHRVYSGHWTSDIHTCMYIDTLNYYGLRPHGAHMSLILQDVFGHDKVNLLCHVFGYPCPRDLLSTIATGTTE